MDHQSADAEGIAQATPLDAMRLAQGAAVLLDVREQDEWDAGHAPGATHIALGELDPGLLDSNRTVVTVCRSGARSTKAAVLLVAAGFEITNLSGGMTAWRDAGLPVVSNDGAPGSIL